MALVIPCSVHVLRSVSTTRVHGPSWWPVNSGAIFDTRQLGPSTRVVETGRPCTRCQKCTRVHGPSTRAVNSGSGNRPLVRPIDVTFGIGCRLIWNWCIRELPPNRIINFLFTARQAVMWTLTIFNISLIWRIDSRVRRARCERDLRLGAIVEPVAIAVCESNGVKTMTTHTHTHTYQFNMRGGGFAIAILPPEPGRMAKLP